MLIPVLLCVQATAAGVQLPESDAARAWAGVGPEVTPVVIAEELLAGDPWLAQLPRAPLETRWGRWADWLASESGRELASPPARAGLLLLAASEDRWEDAWGHFERLGGSPPWTAAMMPYLLPGIPLGLENGADGVRQPLPDGTLFHPVLPPKLPGDPRGSLRHRIATIEDILIADARVTMTITIEPSGVQVDLLHVSGGPVTLSVLLPESFGRVIKIEYIDWMREEEPHKPLTVELLPGSEELSLFGRYSRAPVRLPQVPRGDLPVGLQSGGLWFTCEGDEALLAETEGFASAVAQVFDLPAGLIPPGSHPAVEPWTPTICQLLPGSEGRRKLRALVSAAERYALVDRFAHQAR